MPRSEKRPSNHRLDDLAELVARERAKLRWRVETRVPHHGADGQQTTRKLYQVFQALDSD